jgi:hypothetical protein
MPSPLNLVQSGRDWPQIARAIAVGLLGLAFAVSVVWCVAEASQPLFPVRVSPRPAGSP